MVEINLFPWRHDLRKKAKKRILLELSLALAGAFLLIAMMHFVLMQQLASLKIKLATTEAQLAKANKSLNAVQALHQALNFQKIPEMDRALTLKRQQQILQFLQKLPEWMPVGLTVQTLRFENNVLVLNGIAFTVRDILHFSAQLKKAITANTLLRKEKFLNIKQNNLRFYYELRFETIL